MRPHYYLKNPLSRVEDVIDKISRKRWISGMEVYDLAHRLAQKISGNPARTANCVRLGPRWKGEVKFGHSIVEWGKLEREARYSKNEFCLISQHVGEERMRHYRRKMDYLKTRAFINRIKKEIRNGGHD